MSYPAEPVEVFRSKLHPAKAFFSASDAEAFDRDAAAELIREPSLDAWENAVATGEGALAVALRLLAPEIDMPRAPRRSRAA